MTKFTSFLQGRFRKKEKPKADEVVTEKKEGEITIFSGPFTQSESATKEREELSSLLQKYVSDKEADLASDLHQLISITSEIKAINNQAAILQGERIKRAQQILKKYRDGAFTAWLLTTYGNRQTPYNFLQYYEFYSKMPKKLHGQIEAMPRQAVYTLASREGGIDRKEEIVRNYKGETKQELISLIRSLFPLGESDRRRENAGENTIKALKLLVEKFKQPHLKLTAQQKQTLIELLKDFRSVLDECTEDTATH